METSILNTIKNMLGIVNTVTAFDNQLIVEINMVFNVLNQLGVGPANSFSITGNTETWSNYITDLTKLEMVKTYIYLKVKQVFDPPNSASHNTAIDNLVKELEFRLGVQASQN